jgi:hypothetical protein
MSEYKQKQIFTVMNKKTRSVLQMPDGQTNFNTYAAAKAAMEKYRKDSDFEVMSGTIPVKENFDSKVDEFMKG